MWLTTVQQPRRTNHSITIEQMHSISRWNWRDKHNPARRLSKRRMNTRRKHLEQTLCPQQTTFIKKTDARKSWQDTCKTNPSPATAGDRSSRLCWRISAVSSTRERRTHTRTPTRGQQLSISTSLSTSKHAVHVAGIHWRNLTQNDQTLTRDFKNT